MDSLADILSRRDFDAPPEIAIVKRYVLEHFNVRVEVAVNDKYIIVQTASAALAGTLRMHTLQLKRACQTDKRFVFKIV